MDAASVDICAICLETKRAPKELNCKHSFCAECLENMGRFRGHVPWANRCPLCRASIDQLDATEAEGSSVSNPRSEIHEIRTQMIRLQDVLSDLINTININGARAVSTPVPTQAPTSVTNREGARPNIIFTQELLNHWSATLNILRREVGEMTEQIEIGIADRMARIRGDNELPPPAELDGGTEIVPDEELPAVVQPHDDVEIVDEIPTQADGGNPHENGC